MDHHMNQAEANPQAGANRHRPNLRIEPNLIRSAAIGQALEVLDLLPGGILSPNLEEVEIMQIDDSNRAQDGFAETVHGVFSDDEEEEREANTGRDGGDSLPASDSLLNLQVRPGGYGGYGRIDVDVEEIERQERPGNKVPLGDQDTVQTESENPNLLKQVQAAKNAGLMVPNLDAYRIGHPLLQPPDQEVQSGETNSEGSSSSRRKDPQTYVPKRWTIRNPLKPGIPIIGFNDLDPNDAFNRMQHAKPANPAEFADQAIIEELALHSEGNWNFRRTPHDRQLAARSKARNDLANPGTDSAVVCLEKQRSLEAGPMGLEEKDDVRRYKVFAKVTENLRIRNPYMGQQALASKSVQNQYRQIMHCNSINIARLAVSMIRPARPGFEKKIAAVRGEISLLLEDANSDGCSFCLYDSDFGVSDSSVWLDSQNFPGYCHECHESSNLFQMYWLETMVERYVKVAGVNKEEYKHVDVKRTRLAELLDLDNTRPLKELIDRDNAVRLAEERAKRATAPPVRKDSGFDFNGMNIDSIASNGNVDRSRTNTPLGQGYQMQTRDERQQGLQRMNAARLRSLEGHHQPHSLYQQYSNHQHAQSSISQYRQSNPHSLISRADHMTLLHPQPQRQTLMETTMGGQRSLVIGNSSEFAQVVVNNQPPNPPDNEPDYGPMNLRGGAGGDDEYDEDSDDDEEVELPSLPKTPHKPPVSRSDSTITQPRQTSSRERRMHQQTPTPKARQQKSSATSGKHILPAASTIKYELDAQGREIHHEDDEEDDSEDELAQAQLRGKRLFGFQKGSAQPKSKLENSRDISATPAPSRQRAESSSLMGSNTLAMNKKNNGSAPVATPSKKKRGAPSTPNSAEAPSKKARRSEADLEKFELQKLADEHRTILADEILAPAPPRLEGITPNQTSAAIRRGEAAATARGFPKPRTYGEVVRQGLIDLPELSASRESRNTEARRKYRALYGRLYEEQKERFSLQGKTITNYIPWKATKKSLSLPEPDLGEHTYAGSNASNPAESFDGMEMDAPSIADESSPKPRKSKRASTSKTRSSVLPDMAMSPPLLVPGTRNLKSKNSSSASTKKGGRTSSTAPISPANIPSNAKTSDPLPSPSRQNPLKNKRISDPLVMGPPPPPSTSKNSTMRYKAASSSHAQDNDGAASSKSASGRGTKSGRTPGPIDMESASLSLGQLSIDAKNRPSAMSPTSYDEFFAQKSAVSTINTINQKVRESQALTSLGQGSLQFGVDRSLSNVTNQPRQSSRPSSAHQSQQWQDTPKLVADSANRRKMSVTGDNLTEAQRNEKILQTDGNSPSDSNWTPYGKNVAQGQALVGRDLASVPGHGTQASLQGPQQAVAHGNNIIARNDLSQRSLQVSLPQLQTFARPSGGQSTTPSHSPNISQHTSNGGRITQTNHAVTRNEITQNASITSTPQYQSIIRRPAVSPITPTFLNNPLSSAPFEGQGNMAEPTPTPQSEPYQPPRLVLGSKIAAAQAGMLARSASKAPSANLQNGQQAGLPRHVAVGNENFAPKNSSNLREYQISSPLAQHPHAHGHPQVQAGRVGYMAHQQQPFIYGPIPPAHFLPPRLQSPPPIGIQRYEGILACRGSPYSQIDITKARICKPCRNVRLAIVHHRHFEFTELGTFDGVLNGYFKPQRGGGIAGVDGGVGGSGSESAGRKGEKMRRCMVCTSRACWACNGCPLRVCESCKSVLVNLCKGRMNDLLMFLYRVHLRNDAFLLRSDGGGF